MKANSPKKRIKAMKSYQGRREHSHFLGLFNKDYWRGRKDGRKAPTACEAALAGIKSDELKELNEVRNGVNQMKGEARTNIAHIEGLLDQNRQKTEAMEAQGELLPEGIAQSVYNTAVSEILLATVLMLCEIGALAGIAKATFGQGMLAALLVAILLSALVAIGVKLFLIMLPPERRTRVKWGVLGSGVVLLLAGLVGFVILRAQTFTGSLTGAGVDFGQVSLGNLLLMTGITLGVPLICGFFYEDAQQKKHKAGNSLRLYRERDQLKETANEWRVVLQKFEEFDSRLDAVTEQVIASRSNRYIRGFHIGGARNPEAVRMIGSAAAAR